MGKILLPGVVVLRIVVGVLPIRVDVLIILMLTMNNVSSWAGAGPFRGLAVPVRLCVILVR